MSEYVPSVGVARARYCDSIVRKDGVPHSFVVTPEEHAKNHAEFDRMIAEVERAAAARALEDAADDHDQALGGETYGGAYLRARAEAYRQERGEQ